MNDLEITHHCSNCGRGATIHDWKCPVCGHPLADSPADLAQDFSSQAWILLIPGLAVAAWLILEACGLDLAVFLIAR